ncbi:hypothetical protein CALCODRAFT_554588 [Calocera cornea HHB12733]|uniref:ABM domain-containing protein n=1 Tax=Calocera cornea HHB12733 TaxID=1353952 RepID=A0A165H2K4_9BASI|nr:hypothetical protein CALCODRAFT_554588 [Calocera cornea HHB12733]
MADPADPRFVVLVTLHVDRSKLSVFTPLFYRFLASNRAEKGCIKFDVIVSPSSEEWTMYEVYTDEAAFNAHCDAPHHVEFHKIARDADDPLFTKPPTVRLDYKPLAGVELS